jgi:hypothetical protein
MSAHPGREVLLDVAEGALPAPPHLDGCEACRREVADLQAAMAALVDVDVPEPSPLFWDHLSSRVRVATRAEPAARWGLVDLRAWRAILPLGAMAVVVLAVAFGVSRGRTGVVEDRTAALVPVETPAEEAAGVFDAGDPSLDLIAGLSEGLGWEAATDVGWTTATGSLDAAIDRLDEGERAALQQLLQDALSGKGA